MASDDAFLGTGWSFPPAFDNQIAQVAMTSGVADIERSLEIIFSTAVGERIMNPAFGCNLDEFVFESMDTTRVAFLQNLIKTAILYHEPRIDAEQIDVRPDDLEGILWIHVLYRVRSTNSRFNFVYPFYLNTN